MKKKIKISQLRFNYKNYKKELLSIKNSDSNPFKQFSKWLNQAIKSNVFEPTAMSLATLRNNKVSNRIVLLKSVEKNTFIFYTNLHSRKSKDLEKNESIAAVFWWPQIGKQVRIEGKIKKLVKTKVADTYFSSRSRQSQISAWASNQSDIIPNRKYLEEKIEIVKKRFVNMSINRPKFWSGYVITPFLIEFWQARDHRLHDRIVYKKLKNKNWKKHRLGP